MKHETYPQLVLSYQWVNGSPRITVRDGYICTGNLTDYLEITIYSIMEEHAGSYKCVSPSVHRAISCKLYVYEEKSSNKYMVSTTVISAEVYNGIDSLCVASSVSEGETGIISCQFTQDLSITSSKYLRVYLYRGSDPEPYTVLLYSWDAESSHVYTVPGYKSKGNPTDHFEIAVHNITKEHAGIYKCIVGPSTIRTAKPCTLYVNQGIESFCLASLVPAESKGIVSCRFTEDLSITPRKDLRVYLYKDTVLSYTWINGSSRIETRRGYMCKGNLTDHLDITIYNVSKEHAGLYKCMVVSLGKNKANTCTLHVNEDIKSFCIAPPVSVGDIGIISCRFTEDLSIAPQKDLRIYLYKDAVLNYSWVNGSSHTEARPGYKCIGNLTDHLEIAIYNVTKEHAGRYTCIVFPSENQQADSCNLYVNGACGPEGQ